jgi:uncharacterized membrane protein YhaH (DUF805 family)
MIRLLYHDIELSNYWEWVLSALLVLVPLDLFTTIYAATIVGVEHEVNPIMVWMLTQPILVIVGIHLLVIVAVAGVFEVYHRLSVRSEQYGEMMLQAAKVYLALLVGAGLLVFIGCRGGYPDP